MDIIGAVVLTAGFTIIVGVLGGLARLTWGERLTAFAAAAAWLGVVVTIGGLGGFAPGALGLVPTPVVAFAVLLTTLFAAWKLSPRFRAALLSVPLPALVGLNIVRLAGVFFLLLAAAGRLSNPFASSAGWGDIAVGFLAIPLTFRMLTGHVPRTAARLWNLLGTADLVTAVTLGGLTAVGPRWHLFAGGPGSLAMTQLPWLLIPTTVVPIFLLIHFVVAKKLAAVPAQVGEIRVAPRGAAQHA